MVTVYVVMADAGALERAGLFSLTMGDTTEKKRKKRSVVYKEQPKLKQKPKKIKRLVVKIKKLMKIKDKAKRRAKLLKKNKWKRPQLKYR